MNVGTLGTIVMSDEQAELVFRKWLITGPGTGTNPKAGDVLPAVVVRNNGSTVNVKVFLDGNASVWFPGINPADITVV